MTRIITVIAFLLGSTFLLGQTGGLLADVEAQQQRAPFQVHSPFNVSTSENRTDFGEILNQVIQLDLKTAVIRSIYDSAPRGLSLSLPTLDGSTMQVDLVKRDIFSEDFKVYENDGENRVEIPLKNKLLYYSGLIAGEVNSLVSVALGKNEMTAILSNDHFGDVTLAIDPNQPGVAKTQYIMFSETDRFEERTVSCGNDALPFLEEEPIASNPENVYNTCKDVEIQIHISHRMYSNSDFNSNSATVTTYVQNLMYHVATVYRNENIFVSIGSIVINTAADTYTESSSFTLLQDFGNEIGPTWNTSTDDDMAHLLDTNPGVGGVAWTSSTLLCRNVTYSAANGTYPGPFAYSAVFSTAVTIPAALPNWLWDIEVFAHEMGHNLGSPHTHGCDWNGNNTAIDNCYVTEGSCAPGTDPGTTQGTIMSYCHLCRTSCTGGCANTATYPSCPNPGINLNNGFGTQPGNLIRNTVATRNCSDLINYVPDDLHETAPVNQNTSVLANRECFDGTWTHYYDDMGTSAKTDDTWLMSINKNGQNIGSIGDGTFRVMVGISSGAASSGGGTQISSTYVTNSSGWYVMNRFWDVTPTMQPTNPVSIRFPYESQDLTDLQVNIPGTVHTDLYFFHLDGTSDGNPDNQHATVTSLDYTQYQNGASASLSQWAYSTDAAGNHIAEYQIPSFSSGGGGVGGANGSGALPVELTKFEGELIGNSVHLSWATASEENNAFFTIEHSIDGINFIPILQVEGFGTTQEQKTYHTIDPNPSNGTNYYRLVQTDFDGTIAIFDKIIAIDVKVFQALILRPNILKGNELNVFFQAPISNSVVLDVVDATGSLVLRQNFKVISGNNHKKVDLTSLPAGAYSILYHNTIGTQSARFLKTE